MYKKTNNGCIALNIKSDGLYNNLFQSLSRYQMNNFFVFDMSIPEMVQYRKYGIDYFTRQSDIEKECVLYDDAKGIWIDSFFDDTWINERVFDMHKAKNKKVCIVSPEIHGRENNRLWEMLKSMDLNNSSEIYLCTDKPFEAREYFSK